MSYISDWAALVPWKGIQSKPDLFPTSPDLITQGTAVDGQVMVWDQLAKHWIPKAGGSSSGVSKIIAGTNVTISPSSGLGNVTVNSTASSSPTGPAGGDLDGTYPDPTLAAIGAGAGPIGDSTHVARVTIDTKGRVTALTSVAISTLSNPMTNPGDMIGGGTAGAATRVPASTALRRAWLAEKGTGSAGTLPGFAFASIYDLSDYGVDPSGVADSSTAVNAAISDLNASSNGGQIFWPAGTFKISSTLTAITNNGYHRGSGKGVTTVNFPGTFNGLIFDFSSARKTAMASDMTLVAANTATTNFTAVYYKQYNDGVVSCAPSFTELQLDGYWNKGIEFDNAAANNTQGGTISDVQIVSYAYSPIQAVGIHLAGSSNVQITGCNVFGFATGYLIDGGAAGCEGTWISDCTAVNVNRGVDSSGANTWVENCHASVQTVAGSGSNGIGFRLNANQCFLNQCYCLTDDPTAIAFYFNGTEIKASSYLSIRVGMGRWAYGSYIDAACDSCTFTDITHKNVTNEAVYIADGAIYCVVDGLSYNDTLANPAVRNATSGLGGNRIRNLANLSSNAGVNVPPVAGIVENVYTSWLTTVNRSTNFSVSDNTETNAVWNTTIRDEAQIFDGTSTFTIPSGVTSMSFTAFGRFDASATGQRYIKIKDQTGAIWAEGYSGATDASNPTPVTATVNDLLVSDLGITSLIVTVFQNSGGAINFRTGAYWTASFQR